MRKLANIGQFERLQNQAHSGFISDVSVFNGKFTSAIVQKAREVLPKEEVFDLDSIVDILADVCVQCIPDGTYASYLNGDDSTAVMHSYLDLQKECKDAVDGLARELKVCLGSFWYVVDSYLLDELADNYDCEVDSEKRRLNYMQPFEREQYEKDHENDSHSRWPNFG